LRRSGTPLEHYSDADGIALGAFSKRAVGWDRIGLATHSPQDRAACAHPVSETFPATGIGRRLSDELSLVRLVMALAEIRQLCSVKFLTRRR
jgi:hypothetical protein